jgi:hypothetical protein
MQIQCPEKPAPLNQPKQYDNLQRRSNCKKRRRKTAKRLMKKAGARPAFASGALCISRRP